ncbi:HAMP domain-containing histidine kinase [Ureibacillus chungkukjangi]|uniref:histidine kinase n=1 Tax=Ureibacillus chungkukjangi TaxID=1202712 RepID=A0A318THS7_9BACL|nr:HAMP domain-containing sensor histidine kinase [Ureibacillus chungkukjangi]PYF02638.1 signal transduction histidine kinase [Ureibacillus chungkukjangi]
MNKISTKLALYFFAAVLILELFLMFYLHRNIIHSRVDEEFSRLLANGENHRDVLIENYSESTIKHIVLMENNNDREVMIINNEGVVISSSDENNPTLEKYVPLVMKSKSKTDRILVSDYKDSPYIVSLHPYQNGEHSGYVLMYQSTNSINRMVNELTMHFGLAGATSVVIILIIYGLLSKVLTRPLIIMKEATEKLSKGDFKVTLPYASKDELGELAVAIQKLAKDLERLKKERNEFLASISHELSTPLTYLIGYAKVAMRKDLNEKERDRYLSIIAEEADGMKDLVKDLLDLARIDENSFTVNKEYFWSQPFLDNIYKLVEPSFLNKELKLKTESKKNFQIYADPLRLQQIVINLLDNAMKYSDYGKEVRLEAYSLNGRAVISVSDEGIGIPSDEIEFIFDRLYRVEKSRSRTYGGSGIGLSVVKELVEAHGGTIEVESKLGKGSTFKIMI